MLTFRMIDVRIIDILLYLSKDFDSMHQILNDSKVVTQSVHIPICFDGGHEQF